MSYDEIKKITKKIGNKIVVIFSHPIIQVIINIVILIIAIWTLRIAIETLDKSINQFEQNSISSDSLFNVQLNFTDSLFNIQLGKSKELNDSLISQIRELQKTTTKQLEITDQQLNMSIEIYREQLYSNRPKIIVTKIKMGDTLEVNDKIFKPVIIAYCENKGHRNAYNFTLRSFLIHKNFDGIIFHNRNFEDSSLVVEINSPQEFNFYPIMPLSTKDDFYYCLEITYYDQGLNQKFSQIYYCHYNKSGNKLDFYFCKTDEEIEIKKFVSTQLKEMSSPPLQE